MSNQEVFFASRPSKERKLVDTLVAEPPVDDYEYQIFYHQNYIAMFYQRHTKKWYQLAIQSKREESQHYVSELMRIPLLKAMDCSSLTGK